MSEEEQDDDLKRPTLAVRFTIGRKTKADTSGAAVADSRRAVEAELTRSLHRLGWQWTADTTSGNVSEAAILFKLGSPLRVGYEFTWNDEPDDIHDGRVMITPELASRMRELLGRRNRDDLSARQRRLLTSRVEELAVHLGAALDENDALRNALVRANLEIDFLRRQAELLTEANKTGHSTIVRAVLGLILTSLVTVGAGAAGGVAQQLAADRAAPNAAAPDHPAVDLVRQCDELIRLADRMGDPEDQTVHPGAPGA